MARMRSGLKAGEGFMRALEAAAQWDELETTSIIDTSKAGAEVHHLIVTVPKHELSGGMLDSIVELQYGPINNKLYFAEACSATAKLKDSANVEDLETEIRFTIDARMRSGF